MNRTNEAAFETVIELHLLANGYVGVDRDGFDREHAIFPEAVLGFIRETQPTEWAKLEGLHGDKTGEQVLTDLCKWMDANGALATLRHGFKCYWRTLHAAYFKPRQRQSVMDHQAMNAALDPAVSRFTVKQKEDEEEAELWRGKLQAFRSLYSFLSQIIPYQDSDLERLYVYLRHLSAKLPRRGSGRTYNFDDDVRLEYYRLQKISEGSISLNEGTARPLDGPTEVGSAMVAEQAVPLSRLIDVVNERFGTDFNQADQLFFDQLVEAAMADESLKQAAAVNPEDKFELVFRNLLETLFVERMDQNEEIFSRFMNDPAFQKTLSGLLASEAYKRLRGEPGWWSRYPVDK